MYPLADVYTRWGRNRKCLMKTGNGLVQQLVFLNSEDEDSRLEMSKHPQFVGFKKNKSGEYAHFVRGYMTKNGLELLDLDEHLREKKERLFSNALEEARKRGCVIDCASSDVVVYLEGAKSMEDVEAIGKLMPGYKPDKQWCGLDTLEQLD